MKQRKAEAPTLRGIDGGKKGVRRAFEECRANDIPALDIPVITVLSPEDKAYAATIARLVREA